MVGEPEVMLISPGPQALRRLKEAPSIHVGMGMPEIIQQCGRDIYNLDIVLAPASINTFRKVDDDRDALISGVFEMRDRYKSPKLCDVN